MNFISNTIQIVVFARFPDNVKYLLLKRSPDDDIYPSIWQICTGTRDENETPLKALLRELEEETGINSYINIWNVPFVASYHSIKRNAICFSPVFAVEVSSSTAIKLSEEHTEFLWTDSESASKMMKIPSYSTSLSIVEKFILNPDCSDLYLINFNINISNGNT